jgi:hypothetical protein
MDIYSTREVLLEAVFSVRSNPDYKTRTVGKFSLKAPRTVREYIVVISLVGLEMNNHCTGEDQQQFFSQKQRASDGQ